MSRGNILAQNIKRLRKQHGLSQEKLAKNAGMTYSTLIKIESGANKNPTLETLKKISNALNISINDLIEEK